MTAETIGEFIRKNRRLLPLREWRFGVRRRPFGVFAECWVCPSPIPGLPEMRCRKSFPVEIVQSSETGR